MGKGGGPTIQAVRKGTAMGKGGPHHTSSKERNCKGQWGPHHESSIGRNYKGYEIKKSVCKSRPYFIPKGNLAYTYRAHIHAH